MLHKVVLMMRNPCYKYMLKCPTIIYMYVQ